MISSLLEQLERDEGLRLSVYDDADGKPISPGCQVRGHATIGIGRALDVNGISREEALYLLGNDITRASAQLGISLPWITALDEVRRGALENMAFNMGIGHLLGFKGFLEQLSKGNFEGAAQLMLDSKWAAEVGPRAQRLSLQIRTGEWQ